MEQLDIDPDAAAAAHDLIDAFLGEKSELTGLELYYALERSTSLLAFHTMMRGGPRNRARSGLQQSYGDHNRLLMHGLDQLVAGDLDWYRDRVDPSDPVSDDALHRCFAAVAALDPSREQLVALWLAAALHDCGMLCGRGAHVDVEDGIVLSRPIIDALCPPGLRDLATFVLHHHDYVKGVFLGEVPAALVADDLVALPVEQRPVALGALGCVQVAGAASLGEGRLDARRIEIFDQCVDGTALDDRSTSTRYARLVGEGSPPDAPLEPFLQSAAVHAWHQAADARPRAERASRLATIAAAWGESGADHVVLAAGATRRVETAASGVTVLVLDG